MTLEIREAKMLPMIVNPNQKPTALTISSATDPPEDRSIEFDAHDNGHENDAYNIVHDRRREDDHTFYRI